MFTREMLAKLEAQRAYFGSDECIRERAAPWRDATPSECVAAMAELCADAAAMVDGLPDDEQERILTPPPLAEDVEQLLTTLWQQR